MERAGANQMLLAMTKSRRVHFLRLFSGESQKPQKRLYIAKDKSRTSREDPMQQPTRSTWQQPWEFELLTEQVYRELQKLGEFDTQNVGK